ncbi:hypothetical protein WMY93_029607 [Mugilogobius chulae]|uniref:Uncharacterized protein n=1 Tax=Mugilogobius chulae TaxID=88201 RepID=A0AAW0MS93_9GOBI
MPNQERETEPPAQSSASRPAPQSLSTSAKHSSLTLSPCADRTGDSTQPPLSPVPNPVEASSLKDEEMQSDDVIVDVVSTSPQQEEMEVDIEQPQREDSPRKAARPALTPASFSPPHCKSPEVSTDGVSPSAAETVHSPPRSSPAGLASPVSTQRQPSFDGSPAHATEPCSSPQPGENQNISVEKAEKLAGAETDATLSLNCEEPRSPVSPCNDEVPASERLEKEAEQTDLASSTKSLPDTSAVSPVTSHADVSSPHLSPQRSASPVTPKSASRSPTPVSCPASPRPSSPVQEKTTTLISNETPSSSKPPSPVFENPLVIDEAKVSPDASPVSSPNVNQALHKVHGSLKSPHRHPNLKLALSRLAQFIHLSARRLAQNQHGS